MPETYTTDDVLSLLDGLNRTLKSIEALPANTVKREKDKLLASLNFEQLIACLAVNSISEGEEPELFLPRYTNALNMMQGLGVQMQKSVSDMPRRDQLKIAYVIGQIQ
jgi:hypothetical protein